MSSRRLSANVRAVLVHPRTKLARMRGIIPNSLLMMAALLLIPGSGAGASITVGGSVLDAITDQALVNANVVRSDGSGVATDHFGRFEIGVATESDSITVSHIGYRSVKIAVSAESMVIRLEPRALAVPAVRVTGGLVEEDLADVPASVTVLQADEIASLEAGHFQDLVPSVPNLNWAGSTSRARYFQVRGIGERSHYAEEGPPNFSVGFVMDDVDLSGIGMAAMLADVDQIEVFKGPQSSSFGPNAMAGLINMQSADPGQAQQTVSLAAGNDALLRYSGSMNLPVSDEIAVRFSFHDARANGFRDNVFLGRDDTNRRRENLVRAKVRYQKASGMTWVGTLFRADADNSFDAWAPDNNEDLITYSDNPGKDRQLTSAVSLRGGLPLEKPGVDLVSITTYSDTELEHSFDGDWGNDSFWLADPYNFDPETEGWNYDFSDRTLRDRQTLSQELRLFKSRVVTGSDDFVVGAYFKSMEESDQRNGYLFGGDADALTSTFDMTDVALYGQYGLELTSKLSATVNARLDRQSTSYTGITNPGGTAVNFDVDDALLGGRFALQYNLSTDRSVYAAVSRGYKAGGVNQHPHLVAGSRPFDPEYILNMEAGLRSLGARTSTVLTLFHSLRTGQQVDLSSQRDPNDPNSFFFFIANAEGGRNSGLELEQTYSPVNGIRFFGALGYLNTHVDAYETEDGKKTRGDRAAAHAPEYTARIGGEYRDRSGLFCRLELSAVDEFYFSGSHDQKSEAYQLLNGRLGFDWKSWTIAAWGRNLLDERYAVRGFFFDNDPRAEVGDTRYIAHGDPRQFGVTLSVGFQQN